MGENLASLVTLWKHPLTFVCVETLFVGNMMFLDNEVAVRWVQACNRLLKCGNHRCQAPCHTGACLPCTREVRVACACGATSYRLPCGCGRDSPFEKGFGVLNVEG